MSVITNKIKESLLGPESNEKFEGKVIHVVNQIPYHCILDVSNTNQSILEKLRQFRIQKNPFRVYSEAPVTPAEEKDMNPISHVQKRQSILTALGQTNIWRLTQRRGHSAMYAGIDSMKKDHETLYIGSTGAIKSEDDEPIEVDDINREEREGLSELLQSKYNIDPIFISDKQAYGHYEGYSKQVLWPLMHSMMWSDQVDEVAYWKDYVKVNQQFADKVMDRYKPGDQIWVHDYHLMLVPQMIRNELPDARIGIFMHTPFPSSEIFRCLPRRQEILQGIMGANLVGLQTYDYARHLTSCCTRILGLEYTPYGISGHGALVQIGIYPIGIDVERTREDCKRPGVTPKAQAIQKRFTNKKLIIGRDKLDSVKGVLQKLEAFEVFLDTYPEWREKVVLIQVTSPGLLDTPALEKKANELIARINSKYGSIEFTPAHLFHQHIDRDEYYALLKVADIGLVTPVIDGMNTCSFEYVVAQEGRYSPLILSEFTGTARSMSTASIVNPWDFKQVAKAIADSLSFSQEEKESRYQELHRFVTSHTAHYWASSLVQGLLDSHKDSWGSTAPIDFSRVKLEYENSRKRALVIDYDGSLVPINKISNQAKPSASVKDTLKKLCENTQNIVWVVSGRTQEWLDECLGDIPNLGLSAEHGCFIKDPSSTTWSDISDGLDFSWKKDVNEIFENTHLRTPALIYSKTKTSLAWHYPPPNKKIGASQAMECQNHLEQNLVGKLPIECLTNRMNLEVRPSQVNKGSVIKRSISNYSSIDYIFCVGDSKTSEDMFRALENLHIGGTDVVRFAAIVGSPERKTLANWRIENSSRLEELLNLLIT
ncbi:hypothetical protein G6F56_006833 [Rhizopus delemar]|nr:hypothetical protein G6F56_006833 [Rhizopus delemar]